MRKNFKLCLIGIAIGFSNQITVRAATIKLTQDAEVENLTTRQKSSVKAATELDFTRETPYLIQMENKVPLLLVPADSASGEIEVTGAPLSELITLHTDREVDRALSEVLVEINLIQSLARKHQFQLAFQKLDALQKKHPHMTSLNFIRASLLFITGKKQDAETILRQALAEHPQNEDGKKLLEQIKRK